MCSQWGIQGRTAGAWTVWELPGVFLCVMHANPGPPRLQQRHKEASVKAESASAPNSPHCLIKFSRGTQKAPKTPHAFKPEDGNQPVISVRAEGRQDNEPHVLQTEKHVMKCSQRHQHTLTSIVNLIDLSGSGEYCFCEVTLPVMTLS